MLRVLLVALLLSACAGTTTAPSATHMAVAPRAAKHRLPDYPGTEVAAVTGGVAHMVLLTIASDPVERVRAFYNKQHLTGFDVLEGDVSQASPLHVRDTAGGDEYFIAVHAEDGATMIEVAVGHRN